VPKPRPAQRIPPTDLAARDFGTLSAIYNFSVNLHPILTIYDSAGTDTLNLSGWSTPSLIDLTPGAYSSCNSMTYNIAIAYTCNIENAIGGTGADTITGNSLNNYLDGGIRNRFFDWRGGRRYARGRSRQRYPRRWGGQ
jgi:hypothetical protein